jgi:hypothetical protein
MSDDERDRELRALIEDALEGRAPASTPPEYSKSDRYPDVRRYLEATCTEIEARDFEIDWIDPGDLESTWAQGVDAASGSRHG